MISGKGCVWTCKALDKYLEISFRILNYIEQRKCNSFLKLLISYWEEVPKYFARVKQ